jgi:hypothetical protein
MKRCPYCGKQVPVGLPDPSQFSCCGEIGHADEEEAAEAEAWLQHMQQITEGKQ